MIKWIDHKRPVWGILIPLLMLSGILVLLSACQKKTSGKKFRVAFSQCTSDAWRDYMEEEMKRELSYHDNIEWIYRNAGTSTEKQIRQIRELGQQGIDLLIVSPNEVTVAPAVEEIFDAGIPVVVVDRRISSSKYTAFVGASNFEVGQNAGLYAASLLKGKGEILEVTELPESSPVIDRHRGFMESISKYPGIRLVKRLDFSEQPFLEKQEEILRTQPIDLVFAFSDFLAMDTYKICKKLGIDKKVKIIGIDGLPTPNLGLDHVASKAFTATMLYPTGGKEAIITAINILEKKPFEKDLALSTTVIDSTNIRITRLQNEKLMAQQQDIDKSQDKIEGLGAITRNQTTTIYTISFFLGLAVLMGGILAYYLRENRKINTRLAHQNEEITLQQQQLLELSKKAAVASEAKFNFFTNISHELRTPLTLVLGPLQELLLSPKLHFSLKPATEMVQKNALRLLRLVNQLMDFRKIEEAKMMVHASENDLASFVSEIANAFNDLAKRKHISYTVQNKAGNLAVWFDENMLDKVMFNILSNAFKYTPDQGSINIFIQKDKEEKNAIIRITDSGIGMDPDTASHAFDLFYQGSDGSYKGTGIGLALSKQLIALHKGSIELKTTKWKGSTFDISLPMGDTHFTDQEKITNKQPYLLNMEDAKIYSDAMSPYNHEADEPENKGQQTREYSLLLIEDNIEIRSFIKSRLSDTFDISEAVNGDEGLNLAYEMVPDIIITDLMLPGKDGLFVTDKLKSDIRTSHIPIIMLTAKGSLENQLEGLRQKADAYIVKPFNLDFVEETIRNLISNREILREHYSSELPSNMQRASSSKKIDRKFVNEFSAIVEANIANENFGVDDLSRGIGISKAQLYRKVKALLGLNINDYILNVRLQKAKHLLNNQELSINDISFKVGFSSQAYFSTVFKSKFGMTPSDFRLGKTAK
jgi:signal transduction histidine kinase/AraC-like DNA-binding protein